VAWVGLVGRVTALPASPDGMSVESDRAKRYDEQTSAGVKPLRADAMGLRRCLLDCRNSAKPFGAVVRALPAEAKAVPTCGFWSPTGEWEDSGSLKWVSVEEGAARSECKVQHAIRGQYAEAGDEQTHAVNPDRFVPVRAHDAPLANEGRHINAPSAAVFRLTPYSRPRTLITWAACHLLPLAVVMPRRFSSLAEARIIGWRRQ
jgi:hypothetical protein